MPISRQPTRHGCVLRIVLLQCHQERVRCSKVMATDSCLKTLLVLLHSFVGFTSVCIGMLSEDMLILMDGCWLDLPGDFDLDHWKNALVQPFCLTRLLCSSFQTSIIL